MISVPYVELEKKHEGRFIGIHSHMANLMMPLNWEGRRIDQHAADKYKISDIRSAGGRLVIELRMETTVGMGKP